MTTDDKTALMVSCLERINIEVVKILSMLKSDTAQDLPAEAPAPAPAKVYTYEEARAVLAEKSRTGFRAEVKAILTKYGVTQLSDVRDPNTLAAIVAEAEEIKVG